jgi:hypothetical protein
MLILVSFPIRPGSSYLLMLRSWQLLGEYGPIIMIKRSGLTVCAVVIWLMNPTLETLPH